MIFQLEAQNSQRVKVYFAASTVDQMLSTKSVIGKIFRMNAGVVQRYRKKGQLLT